MNRTEIAFSEGKRLGGAFLVPHTLSRSPKKAPSPRLEIPALPLKISNVGPFSDGRTFDCGGAKQNGWYF